MGRDARVLLLGAGGALGLLALALSLTAGEAQAPGASRLPDRQVAATRAQPRPALRARSRDRGARRETTGLPEVPSELVPVLRLSQEGEDVRGPDGALALARAWADAHGREAPGRVLGPVGTGVADEADAPEVDHE